MAKELYKAWKKLCATNMMEASFRNVGLTLNIDGSQDSQMKFQGQEPEKPAGLTGNV